MTLKSPLELVAEVKATISEVSLDNAQATCDKADVIIDVREPAEYMAGHLPNAVNIPRGLLEFKINDVEQVQAKGADSNIVLYCKTSGRSALATQSLNTLGFTNVTSILGGYDAWHEAGMPIVEYQDDVNFG